MSDLLVIGDIPTLPPTKAPSRTEAIRVRGMGRIFPRGRIWWIAYSDRHGEQRESSYSTKRGDAERLLKKRIQDLGQTRFHTDPRLTVEDILKLLEQAYQIEGRRSAETLKFRLLPLNEAFKGIRASDVTGAQIERYKALRRVAKKAPATINRELAALRRAYRLAIEQDVISSAPTIKLFRENNARQGFIEPGDFERVLAGLPAYLVDFVRFAYFTGWRKGELTTLAWSDVDRTGGVITLRAEHSKNGESRPLPIDGGELQDIIERRWTAREIRHGETIRLSHLVFHNSKGLAIRDFRKRWKKACDAAGVAGLLFHDLRRSAVREMDRAGVKQPVAMKITGHRTDSMWRRYRIVSLDEVRQGLSMTHSAIAMHREAVVQVMRSA